MSNLYLLSLTIFTPLAGVLFILLTYALREDQEAADSSARWIALWASLATFVVSLFLWSNFDATKVGFQFIEKVEWISSLGIHYYVGIDGISLFFVLLSTFLTPICVLASWSTIRNRPSSLRC